MPQIGDIYRAAWGRYQVTRVAGGKVTLRDLRSAHAYIEPTLDKLAADYILEESRVPDPLLPGPPMPAVRAVPLPLQVPGLTLGAVRPIAPSASSRGMTHGSFISLPDVELRYWLPCVTRSGVDGFTGEPHAYFIVSNQRPLMYCDACGRSRGRVEAPSLKAVGVSSAVTEVSRPPPPPQGVSTAASPAPTPLPAGPPWGDDKPVWEIVGGKDKGIGKALYEDWSERAAIIEYQGLESRAVAELLAYRAITARAA